MDRLSDVKVSLRRFLPVVVMLLLILCVSGCSSKDHELVGIWNNTNVPETMEFKADKTGTITAVDKKLISFTWHENAKHKYSVDINYGGQKTAVNCVVQDNTLILENGMVKETYRKKL